MKTLRVLITVLFFTATCSMATTYATASLTATAGSYKLQLSAIPGKLAVGKTTLYLLVQNTSGQPVTGATVKLLAQMPTMNMGEKEQTARAVSDKPGLYMAPAQLAMEGDYDCTIHIFGPAGAQSTVIRVSTGQDVGEPNQEAEVKSTSLHLGAITAGLAILVLLALLVLRVRRQGVDRRIHTVLNRSVLGGALLVAVALIASFAAVSKFRRPGSMTPLEAQGMQMEIGTSSDASPVELYRVTSSNSAADITASGQILPGEEDVISPRVTGTLTWMPLYIGDHVTAGQVVARLDTSQSGPLAAAQRAAVKTAEQAVNVSRKEYQQAIAAINEAHAEVGMKEGAFAGSAAGVKSAKEAVESARAELQAQQGDVADAHAQQSAANADLTYWKAEIAREASLLKAGAITREEYERELSQTAGAEAKKEQAIARIGQVMARRKGLEAAVRKAEAEAEMAEARLKETKSELDSHFSHVSSTQAIADSAKQKISQAIAQVDQAQAMSRSAEAEVGYSELRAPISGVVTQRLVSQGVLLMPGQPILRIASTSRLRVQAFVGEEDLLKTRVGSNVAFRTSDGVRRVATITSVASQVDQVSRLGLVEAQVMNSDNKLVAGESVKLAIQMETQSGVSVPSRAVVYRNDTAGNGSRRAYVWMFQGNRDAAKSKGTAHLTPVTLGSSRGRFVIVVSGIAPGDLIVTAGQDYLTDGDAIAGEEVSDENR